MIFHSQEVAMPVVCDICGTLNRHNAMFCLGCASRLPAFAPSGPSALPALEARRRAMGSGTARSAGTDPAALPGESSGLWIRLGLVMLAMGIAFVGWYVYVTRKVVAPAPVAQLAAASAPAGAPPRAGTPVDTEIAPVEPVPVTPSVPVHPVRSAARVDDAPGPPVAAGPRPVAATPAPQPRPRTRVAGARDPVRACANLDYLSMAQCQSAQCQTAGYRWHPRCEAVREEELQIREARRRLALGD